VLRGKLCHSSTAKKVPSLTPNAQQYICTCCPSSNTTNNNRCTAQGTYYLYRVAAAIINSERYYPGPD